MCVGACVRVLRSSAVKQIVRVFNVELYLTTKVYTDLVQHVCYTCAYIEYNFFFFFLGATHIIQEENNAISLDVLYTLLMVFL